jgi:hypothetical protein
MKRTTLTLVLIFFAIMQSFSQAVSEQVSFDNPNDLADHFYGLQSMVQIPANGVTGGCLDTPDSINWGNDNSIYCSKFAAADTEFLVSVMFYYSDSVINPNSYDRAVSIFLRPHTDPNHYVIGSFSHDKKIEGLSYFAANSSNAITMTNNHWYKLNVILSISNNFINAILELEDKGANGQSAATSMGSIQLPFPDTLLANDNAIEVSVIGSKSGGGIYLDNFEFNGYKSADSCLTASIRDISNDADLKLIREGDKIQLLTDKLISNCEAYDLNGRRIKTWTGASIKSIDISGFGRGIYLFRFDGFEKAFRFSIQ